MSLPPTRALHLVRHGAVENPRAITYGRIPGFSLSEPGRAQARAAAAYLRGELDGESRIVSSPLERARETAEIIAGKLGGEANGAVETDERLTEATSWKEGLPRAFDARAYLERALSGRAKHERPRAVALRMRAALSDVLASMGTEASVVVVSHQVPIRLACVAFEHDLGGPGETIVTRMFPWLRFRTRCDHGSITTLRFEGSSLVDVRYWEPS